LHAADTTWLGQSFYKQAVQQRKLMSAARGPNDSTMTTEDVQLKHRECMCYMQLQDDRQALNALERIPREARTLAINLTLGKLYHHSGLKRNAISA
jgi:hypothetical protein